MTIYVSCWALGTFENLNLPLFLKNRVADAKSNMATLFISSKGADDDPTRNFRAKIKFIDYFICTSTP